MTVVDAPAGPGTLANGIRYVTLHRPGAEVTTVSVWVLAGSRHETVPGVAHLVEHLVMQCVPAGRSMRVVDEIEAWGGEANAVTTRDHVVLHARVPTAEALTALRVLAAAITNARFDAELVNAERRVVQEELRLAASDPTDVVHDVFFTTAYGDDPIGRPVGGTAAGVERLGPADVTTWAQCHVRPATLAVVVCGGLTDQQVAAGLADSSLAHLTGGTSRPDDRAAPMTAGRRFLPVTADTAAVVVGGTGFALSDPGIVTAEIVVELLANSNASVINEEIRSRRGLSYDVWGAVSGYRDTGSWRFAISTAPEQREQVADLAVSLLTSAVRRGWTDDQARAAGRRSAGLLVVQAESSLEEALLHGDRAFVGDAPGYSMAAHVARLASITGRQVNETAEIMTDRLVVATAGGD
ncbi:MAG TPA: pitrilysin family protein [Streptosporangiaceae bacterium]|nr:pitrilysin family protein [Streptosporangiaceae bacterium]